MKRKIKESELPKASIVSQFIDRIDYHDTFSVTLKIAAIPVEDLYIGVFAHSPKWVNKLLEMRNLIVKPLGIETDSGEMKKENLMVGKKTGIFKIYAISENEIIAGENEKHLNFRVSVLKNEGILTISTLVCYNNRFGKLYFSIVRPFHRIVATSMMKNAIANNRI